MTLYLRRRELRAKNRRRNKMFDRVDESTHLPWSWLQDGDAGVGSPVRGSGLRRRIKCKHSEMGEQPRQRAFLAPQSAFDGELLNY